MNLSQYEETIQQIQSSDIGNAEKATALDMLANEISRCAWQTTHKNWADEVQALARSASISLGGASLEGMDSLAQKGLLEAR